MSERSWSQLLATPVKLASTLESEDQERAFCAKRESMVMPPQPLSAPTAHVGLSSNTLVKSHVSCVRLVNRATTKIRHATYVCLGRLQQQKVQKNVTTALRAGNNP